MNFKWSARGPLDRAVLDTVIAAVQQRLDLLAVLRERYGLDVEESGDRWRCACPLRSLVPGFDGTCAEQDASESSGETPRNLWVSEGETTLVWRCHSCKRHGDVVDLLEHADDLPREGQAVSLRAVRLAAQLAGVAYLMDGREPGEQDEVAPELVQAAPRPPARRAPSPVDFDRARAINYAAASLWHELLWTDAGAEARRELARRKVSDDQARAYQLGYAPAGWRTLVKHLVPDLHADACVLGLLDRSPRHASIYDLQRDRLVLPYCEPERDGRPAAITGFAGRDLSKDPRAPKWMNSKNVPGVWEKSSAVFGLYQALLRVQSTGIRRVTITEGGFDAIAFDSAGLPSGALVSTALSEHHLAVLVAVLGMDALTLALDGDTSGRREAIVAATTALAFGLPYERVTLIDPGDAKDPDDLSPSQLADAWAEPLSIVDFALRFGELASRSQRLALVAVLPDDHAERLAKAWTLDASEVDRQRARSRPTPMPAIDDAVDVDTLPPDVARQWLTQRMQLQRAELAAHERSDPFANAASHDAFKDWFTRGEALRAELARTQKRLASLGKPA